MTGGVRCERTELLVEQCSHCRAHAAPELVEVTARFFARFSGRCANCDGRIHEGDRIGRTIDGEYVCGGCAA